MNSSIPKRKIPKLVKAVSLAEHDFIVEALTDQLEFVTQEKLPGHFYYRTYPVGHRGSKR